MTDVPEQLRRDNWALFVHARSHDPSVKVPYTRELVGSLINTMKIAGEKRYDKDLAECDLAAQQAIQIYSDDWKKAVIICGNVLNRIGHIIYDKNYATPQGDSFKFIPKHEVSK